MAKIAGKHADFAITKGSVAGTPAIPTGATDPLYHYTNTDFVRIEQLSGDITLNIESRTEETTGYGSDFDEFDVMTYTWSIDIDAYYADGTDETEQSFMLGLMLLAKRKFLFSPAGALNNGTAAADAGAANPKYAGRVVIASANVNPVRPGISHIRARLNGDGQLFRDVA